MNPDQRSTAWQAFWMTVVTLWACWQVWNVSQTVVMILLGVWVMAMAWLLAGTED